MRGNTAFRTELDGSDARWKGTFQEHKETAHGWRQGPESRSRSARRQSQGQPGSELEPDQGSRRLGDGRRTDDGRAGVVSEDAVRTGAQARDVRPRTRQGRSLEAHRPA